jgi:hypothetical protein
MKMWRHDENVRGSEDGVSADGNAVDNDDDA